jgi:hypothetical protein
VCIGDIGSSNGAARLVLLRIRMDSNIADKLNGIAGIVVYGGSGLAYRCSILRSTVFQGAAAGGHTGKDDYE